MGEGGPKACSSALKLSAGDCMQLVAVTLLDRVGPKPKDDKDIMIKQKFLQWDIVN